MLLGLALLLIVGLLLGGVAGRLTLPRLIGMLLAGMVLGPYALNVIDSKVLAMSSELRTIALIIILTRAGLALSLGDLKRVGRPAILLCFVPATFEIVGTTVLAPWLFGLSYADAAVMGAVLAAVSPAVIVPKMLDLINRGFGVGRAIPQMLMAGSSVDDVYVIVIFTAAMQLASGHAINPALLASIPLSLVLGIAIGAAVGLSLNALFQRIALRASLKTLICLALSMLLVGAQSVIPVPYSGLLAVMSAGVALHRKNPNASAELQAKYEKLWIGAEILLFALVGASVDVRDAWTAGPLALVLIFGALAVRGTGVLTCLIKTPLNRKEKAFCLLGYAPKATVQAAIGGLPLAAGLASGTRILTVAVLSILVTAPLFAFLIDRFHNRLLERAPGAKQNAPLETKRGVLTRLPENQAAIADD